jgi:hypothetical protein
MELPVAARCPLVHVNQVRETLGKLGEAVGVAGLPGGIRYELVNIKHRTDIEDITARSDGDGDA